MKNKFLKLGALVAMTMCSVVSCSCGKKDTDDSGNTIVRFSIRNYITELDGWRQTVAKANELLAKDNKKIKIELEELKVGSSWDDYFAKVRTNILQKKGGTIGRIAESHMPQMRKQNLLGEVTDLANKLMETGEYNNDAFGGVAKEGNKYYGLPSGLQHMVVFYNKDKFDAYNAGKTDAEKIPYPSGDWNDATTFDEIRSMALKLTSGSGAGKQFGFSAGPFMAYGGMYAKNSGGYNIFDEEGNCRIYSQEWLDVYNWLGGMLYDDKSSPNISESLQEGGLGKFTSGNVAILIDGIYNIHDILTKCKFTVGVAAIPAKAKADGTKYKSYSTNFTDCYWVSKNSKHPADDQTAIEYLMKSEAIKKSADYQVGGVPIKNDCVENYFEKLQAAGLSKTACDVIREGAKNTINVPYTDYYNEADLKINAKLGMWMNKDPDWPTDTYVRFMDTTIKSFM